MDSKKIREYLKDLSSLESEKYRLEEIRKTIVSDKENKEIKLNSPNTEKENIRIEREQKKEQLKLDIKNKKDQINALTKSIKWDGNDSGVFFIIMSIVFFALSILKGIFKIEDGVFVAFSMVLIAIVIAYLIISKSKKSDKDEKIKLEQEVNRLEKNLNDKINSLDEEYRILVNNSDSNYEEYKKNLLLLCKNDENYLKDLEVVYEDVLYKLNELYSVNIIFEKYRNLAAVTMFYEYFSSSRVFELEGKDGAYNLYETEIRQNLIINNLNKINDNLEQIKDNQYCMYNELKNINSSLETVNKNLIDGLNDIAMLQMANLAVNAEISKNIKTIKNIQVHDYIMH